MASLRLDEELDSRQNAPKKAGKFRFELGAFQLFFYVFCTLLVMSWMFVFGVLVGRGVPLISSEDFSLRARFLRFLALDKELPKQPENIAETWEKPGKMVESLDYYANLTQKGTPGAPPAGRGSASAGHSPSGDSPKAAVKPSPPAPASTPQPATSAEASKQPQPPVPNATPADPSGEHFTLLVSSLKDAENAHRLFEQLKSKGYNARMETLDLGGGQWNRVLVGSFPNRDTALRFATEFNRKEHMEGLVIRE